MFYIQALFLEEFQDEKLVGNAKGLTLLVPSLPAPRGHFTAFEVRSTVTW